MTTTSADDFLFASEDHIGAARDNLIAAFAMINSCDFANPDERSALSRLVGNGLDEINEMQNAFTDATASKHAGATAKI